MIFQDFDKVADRLSSSRRPEEVDELLSTLEGRYPIFEDENTVVFLHRGTEGSVSITGDMGSWVAQPMTRLPGTDLWFRRERLEPDARIEYLVDIDRGASSGVDPLNPHRSLNGLWQTSELAMPGYQRHPLLKGLDRGIKGGHEGLISFSVGSKALGYEHEVEIMIPASLAAGARCPVVYFQDGRDYIECAYAPHIIRSLTGSGAIPPVAAVFVTPPNLHKPAMPNRMTEYGLTPDYIRFFCEELVPFVEERVPAIRGPESRLVVGDSYGGLISVATALRRPDVFKKAYGQSGYFSFESGRLAREVAESPKRDVELYMDVGTYERKVGAAFLPATETDFLEGNRRMRDALLEKGYALAYREYNEGHTWGNWRRHLIDALVSFFGKE